MPTYIGEYLALEQVAFVNCGFRWKFVGNSGREFYLDSTLREEAGKAYSRTLSYIIGYIVIVRYYQTTTGLYSIHTLYR